MGKYKHVLRSLAMLLCVLASTVFFAFDTSVETSASNDLIYTYDDGVLTYDGTGGIPYGMDIVDLHYGTIKKIIIKGGITSIGAYAFSGLPNLEKVEINAPIESIGDQAFYECESLVEFVIPDKVSTIGSGAFGKCTALRSVYVPTSVKYIGQGSFGGCEGIVDVYIEDIVSWCGIEFEDENSNPAGKAARVIYNGAVITQLLIPVDVTAIGKYAFANCTSITEVVISYGVETIGDNAFYGCSSLESIKLVDSISVIGDGAFSQCTSLSSVTLPKELTSFGYSFQYCTSLEHVTIPSGATEMAHAFSGCENLHSAAFLGSAPEDYSYVFDGVASDFKVYCHTDASGFTFPTWNGYSCIAVDELLDEELTCRSGLKYSIDTSDNTACVTGCSLSMSDGYIYIPGRVTYHGADYTVDAVSAGAFSNQSGILGVNVPVSVTSIGAGAFESCTELGYVLLCAKEPIAVGEGCFDGCPDEFVLVFCDESTGITAPSWNGYNSVKLDSDVLDKKHANADGVSFALDTDGKTASVSGAALETDVTEIAIPASVFSNGQVYDVVSIGQQAFYNCSTLRCVVVSEGIRTIGDFAFYMCSELVSAQLPESVTNIGMGAFGLCRQLPDISIPAAVTEISEGAYIGCNSLTDVVIPSNITSIGDYAFGMCESLRSITVLPQVVTVGADVFAESPSVCIYTYENTAMHAYALSQSLDHKLIDGDVDGDGTLTNSDITLMLRFITGWNIDTEGDLHLIDVSADGKINNRDIIACIRKVTFS